MFETTDCIIFAVRFGVAYFILNIPNISGESKFKLIVITSVLITMTLKLNENKKKPDINKTELHLFKKYISLSRKYAILIKKDNSLIIKLMCCDKSLIENINELNYLKNKIARDVITLPRYKLIDLQDEIDYVSLVIDKKIKYKSMLVDLYSQNYFKRKKIGLELLSLNQQCGEEIINRFTPYFPPQQEYA